jgi:hypothetical protein
MKKHTATHEGFTFTRNSAGRAYTHVVVVRQSVAADRLHAERSARTSWSRNLDWHKDCAAGTAEAVAGYDWESAEKRAERAASADAQKIKARAVAMLDLGEEGYVAEQLARFDARDQGKLAADGDTYYTSAGWCGRPDLAAKLAASSGGVAVACTMVDTKAKAVGA